MGAVKRSFQLVVVSLIIGLALKALDFNPLKGLDSNWEYSNFQLQFVVAGFCLSPLPGQLLAAEVNGADGENFTTAQEGDLQDEEYEQGSIYAILYAMYRNAPELISNHGVKYQFTFNTWGIAPSPYPVEDPQRHGKAAYRALVTQPPVMEYIKTLPEGYKLQIAEVGCGTGAGANLITREVHPTSEYLAMDMQAAAINTCKRLHATEDNQGLTCQLIPNGVGINGSPIPLKDSSLDIVVISETHIADVEIGELEKSIFAEIRRVLKPGGFFVWGNALPTRVWLAGNDYLPTAGFALAHEKNHTQGAIVARDEDKDRVDLAVSQLLDPYYGTKIPYFGERCTMVAERLIANFYRHPGTAMYIKMTTGFDSYMHQAWKAVK
jgi:ubiquinone/menaquinone biosynthesis C-methylase UbiE